MPVREDRDVPRIATWRAAIQVDIILSDERDSSRCNLDRNTRVTGWKEFSLC